MGDSRLSADPQAQLRRACAEMDRGLRAGEEGVAERLLEGFPELASCDELALELIYNEYVAREELGQSPAIEEWYRRFPHHRERLERLFHVDELLRDQKPVPTSNGDLVTTVGVQAGCVGARPGGWLGRYELLEEVGRGGMGVVYKARQPGIDRLVAVKMLRGQEASGAELARLLNEARLVGQLRHPGIVQIFEAGEHDGQPYLALEYADGGSLDRWLAGKPLPAREAAEMARDLCRAVQHAHDQGIVHRDLTPANVLLTTERPGGGAPASDPADRKSYAAPLPGGAVKITDFGLARQLGGLGQTRSGHALGTASYMPPEQAEGRAGWAKPACDIYALGAILYELLTGRPPHLGDSVVNTLHLVVHADPVSPRLLRPGLPRDLETVCLKCLDKEPPRRYASAADLAEDLNRFLDGLPVRARPLPWPARLWRQARRQPALAGLVGMIAASLVALVVGWVHFTRQVEKQRDLAIENEGKALEEKAEADGQRAQAEREKREAEAQRQRAATNEQAAWRELSRARRMLLTGTLLRAESLADRDPVLARVMLDSKDLCPPDLRDFAWGSLRRHVQRKVAFLPTSGGEVRGMAWSPDGARLVTAGVNGFAILWDATAGKERGRFPAPPDVQSLAVAPGGTIALGGAGAIRLHDWEGKPLGELLPRSKAAVYRLVFLNPNTLVSVSLDGVWVWNLASGKAAGPIQGHKGKVTAVALADGGLLATAGDDRTIRLWDVQTLEEKRAFRGGHRKGITSLAVLPGRGVIVASDAGGSVVAWDTTAGVPRVLASGILNDICLAATQDGKQIAWQGELGAIHMCDATKNFHTTRHKPWYTPTVRHMAWSPDGGSLATAGDAAKVLLFHLDVRPWRKVGEWPSRGAWSVAFQGNDKLLAVVQEGAIRTGQHTLRRVGLDGGPSETLGTISAARPCFALPPGQLFAWTGGADGLRTWGLSNPTVNRRRLAGAIQDMAVSPDATSYAVAGSEGEVRMLSARDDSEMCKVGIRSNTVHQLAYSPNGKYLAFLDGKKGDTRLHVYDIPGRTLLPARDVGATYIRWLRDSQFLVVGCADGMIQLRDPATGAVKATTVVAQTRMSCATISPGGETLATGGVDGEIRLWHIPTGQERLTLLGHTMRVQDLAFSPDGKKLASAAGDPNRSGGEVLVWESD